MLNNLKQKMEKQIFLLSRKGNYYISEGESTYTFEEATRYSSINEMIRKVPIMKDWNWDYGVYTIDSEDNREFIKDNIWMDEYYDFKENEPKQYKKLYNSKFRL